MCISLASFLVGVWPQKRFNIVGIFPILEAAMLWAQLTESKKKSYEFLMHLIHDAYKTTRCMMDNVVPKIWIYQQERLKY